jgi:hypothetical protein
MVDISRGLGNLRHEMIHPLLKDWWPQVPAWLDEGVASLYGTARFKRGRYRFLVNYRLRHLRRAAARNQLPTLVGLARSTYDDVHGPHERAFYAVARYLLLRVYRRGDLTRFVRDMRAGIASAERQLSVLERYVDYERFLRWAKKLRR